MAISAEHRSKFCSPLPEWWLLQISEDEKKYNFWWTGKLFLNFHNTLCSKNIKTEGILWFKWSFIIMMPAQEKFLWDLKHSEKLHSRLRYFSMACSGESIPFRIEYPTSVIMPNLFKMHVARGITLPPITLHLLLQHCDMNIHVFSIIAWLIHKIGNFVLFLRSVLGS